MMSSGPVKAESMREEAEQDGQGSSASGKAIQGTGSDDVPNNEDAIQDDERVPSREDLK